MHDFNVFGFVAPTSAAHCSVELSRCDHDLYFYCLHRYGSMCIAKTHHASNPWNIKNIWTRRVKNRQHLCDKWNIVLHLELMFRFWNVPFLECALFGMCHFWNVPTLECALFGMCPFQNLPFLECALFGIFPFRIFLPKKKFDKFLP